MNIEDLFAGDFGGIHLLRMAEIVSAASSAEYYNSKMNRAASIESLEDFHTFALNKRTMSGLVLEFGVASGRTINHIAEVIGSEKAYGFDSFLGLPETWRSGFEQGTFRQPPPAVRENVELVVGLFAETLPGFLACHAGPVSYLHVDCDLYSSTADILRILHKHRRLVPGTVIVFDEYFNYPGWENHEFKAFQEYVAKRGVKYDYFALRPSHQQVAVRITKVSPINIVVQGRRVRAHLQKFTRT